MHCAMLFNLLATATRTRSISVRHRHHLLMKRDNGGGGGGQQNHLYPKFSPKTQNQKKYMDNMMQSNNSIIACTGPAGCGKTALACHYAMSEFKLVTYKKMVLTRPLVTVEQEEIGFLPGSLNSKMDPWTRPMMDIFQEYYPMSVLQNMLKEGQIEIAPLAFMRGRTFKNALVIADEMQNSSPSQMLMVMTRIGQGSKIIITGDVKQTDISRNGLVDLLHRLNGNEKESGGGGEDDAGCCGLDCCGNGVDCGSNGSPECLRNCDDDGDGEVGCGRGSGIDGIAVSTLTMDDVVRHPVIIKVLELYNDGDDNSNNNDKSKRSSEPNRKRDNEYSGNNLDAAMIPKNMEPNWKK